MLCVQQGVQGISDIITIPGLVNVDFADVCTIMSDSGTAMLGVGIASGKNRAEEAAIVRTVEFHVSFLSVQNTVTSCAFFTGRNIHTISRAVY